MGVTAGNQPLSYFNTQESPQDLYGMLSLSVPIGGGASRSREICFQMGELELKKKKLDIYFELFERGVVTQDEIDTLRQSLFPTPSNSKPNSVKVRPQATIRY